MRSERIRFPRELSEGAKTTKRVSFLPFTFYDPFPHFFSFCTQIMRIGKEYLLAHLLNTVKASKPN